MSDLTFEQFKELNKREVNRSIASKLGYELCEGIANKYRDKENIEGLETKNKGSFWNPYGSYSDAFCLMCDMSLGMPAVFKDNEEARLLIVYYAYLESLK